MRTGVTKPSRPASAKTIKKAGRDGLVTPVRIYDRDIIENKRHLNLNVQSPPVCPRRGARNSLDEVLGKLLP